LYHALHNVRILHMALFACSSWPRCHLSLTGFAIGGHGNGLGLGQGHGLFGSSYGRQGREDDSDERKSHRKLASSDEKDTGRLRTHQSALPVGDIRLASDAARQAQCAQSNGTCVVPTACQTADVYEEGRMNFHCNLTSVCCLPQYSLLDGMF